MTKSRKKKKKNKEFLLFSFAVWMPSRLIAFDSIADPERKHDLAVIYKARLGPSVAGVVAAATGEHHTTPHHTTTTTTPHGDGCSRVRPDERPGWPAGSRSR